MANTEVIQILSLTSPEEKIKIIVDPAPLSPPVTLTAKTSYNAAVRIFVNILYYYPKDNLYKCFNASQIILGFIPDKILNYLLYFTYMQSLSPGEKYDQNKVDKIKDLSINEKLYIITDLNVYIFLRFLYIRSLDSLEDFDQDTDVILYKESLNEKIHHIKDYALFSMSEILKSIKEKMVSTADYLLLKTIIFLSKRGNPEDSDDEDEFNSDYSGFTAKIGFIIWFLIGPNSDESNYSKQL